MSLIQLKRAEYLLGLKTLPAALPVGFIATIQTNDDVLSQGLTETKLRMRQWGAAGLWCDALMSAISAGGLSALVRDDGEHEVSATDLERWMTEQDEQPSKMLAAWFKAQGVGRTAMEVVAPPAPAAPPEAVLRPSPAVPAVAESWHIKEPERAHGYTLELYRVLKAAHDAGQPRPKARDVLDSWAASKPHNILEVMADGFKYMDSNGDPKLVDLNGLRTAINRMTSER